jgi:L-aspartate oxidase
VGAGVAGLNCALHLPEDKSVLIICKGTPDRSDSYLAQGGICRLIDEQDFEPYYEDTMRAGHGENNPAAVECMIRSSQDVISQLVAIGVDFARRADGSLDMTREGGHGKKRICYHEDCTGKEITTRLLEKVRTLKNVEICDEVVMLDIITSESECYGIVAHDKRSGETKKIFADFTVLASGGIGGVFDKSTNFRILTGDGVAICLKHGVAVDNINYIQIHPTTLYTGRDGERSFLISESVRGEGAHLLDKNFQRFTDELQPRDVVTAAIKKKMKEDNSKFVWLDMRPIPEQEVRSHFPGIVQRCADEGIDVFKECVPVVPAQHYFMGGIRSDLDGKTTCSRLFAVVETCCNGVHGANRLASNSLLESLLFAERAAYSIAGNYTHTDKKAEEYASSKVDMSEYTDYQKVLDDYKKMVLKAIEEAENVKPHNKCN